MGIISKIRKKLKERRARKYFPKLYVEKMTDIDPKVFKENNIKGIIMDLDNTIIDIHTNVFKGAEEWIRARQKEGYKMMILSNTIFKGRVKYISKALNLDYILFAMKPWKSGFLKAADKLGLDPKDIALIGDQVFTDIEGANKVGMFPILVKPISVAKDYFISLLRRPFEKRVIKEYLESLDSKKGDK